MRVETREVLADAYLGGVRVGNMLSHAVVVDDAGHETEVLCDRVKLDNLADCYASDPAAEPTCQICRRRLAKRKEK